MSDRNTAWLMFCIFLAAALVVTSNETGLIVCLVLSCIVAVLHDVGA